MYIYIYIHLWPASGISTPRSIIVDSGGEGHRAKDLWHKKHALQHSNVVKATINHLIVDDLYHPCMVNLGLFMIVFTTFPYNKYHAKSQR